MRIASLSAVLLACAHGADASPPPSAAAAPGHHATAPATVAATTADAAVPDETGGCAADSDCALTRVEAGACCPMLCSPRVVTRKVADALESRTGSCGKGRCPDPLCRPPFET